MSVLSPIRSSTVRPSPAPRAPAAAPPPAARTDAFERAQAPMVELAPPPVIYDGITPAAGTTNTNAGQEVNAPYQNRPSERSRTAYDNAIDQFAVANNPRYFHRDSDGDGWTDTFCNIFVSDVTRAMGTPIPHRIDASGAPVTTGGVELDANATNNWLNQHGAKYGWRQVSAEEAQALANQGHPAVASWNAWPQIGHIGMVRPGELTANGPALSQAGSWNVNHAQVYDVFPRGPTEFWVNDSGTSVGGGSGPTTPTTPPAPGGLTAPASDLGVGASGAQVEQLQRALVSLGHLSQADMNTGPGTYGPRTEAAVRAFQSASGVSATGFYGPLTRAALQKKLAPPPTTTPPTTTPPTTTPPKLTAPSVDLGVGASGPQVEQLQKALVSLGHLSQADLNTGPGTFGPRTEAAVRAFQAASGVSATGFYGPLTRAALQQKLGAAAPATPTTPTAPVGSPDDAALAKKIDAMLSGTGLQGQGAQLTAMAKKYGVPVELGLAMFWMEGQWNSAGLAPKNNNPGNLRFANQAGATVGVDGFARFPTVAAGIEAYFKLMSGPTYKPFIDAQDWNGLTNIYAPDFDGNDSAHYADVIRKLMPQYRTHLGLS